MMVTLNSYLLPVDVFETTGRKTTPYITICHTVFTDIYHEKSVDEGVCRSSSSSRVESWIPCDS